MHRIDTMQEKKNVIKQTEAFMNLFRKSFIGALGCMVVFSTSLAADLPRPLVVAHRGLLQHGPENTLANFRACLELRLGFEFDVAQTKDGHLVCIHDNTLDRTTNGTGLVSDATLKEIQQLDAGSWFDSRFAGEKVPTVEKVIQLIEQYNKHQFVIAVDLKIDKVEDELVALARRHHVLDKLLFIGNTIDDSKVRDRLKRASKQTQTAAVANDPGEFDEALSFSNANWVYFRYVPSEKEMSAVHGKKKRAFIAGKTVAGELPENWQQVSRVGMDAVLTDFPLKLQAVLRH